jgi:APA family basic amino acid/polyamine antiporter
VAAATAANLLFDYAVGAAAIARSLSGYFFRLLHTVGCASCEHPAPWLGAGGKAHTDWIQPALVPPLIIAVLTVICCFGVRSSTVVNNMLTCTKVRV